MNRDPFYRYKLPTVLVKYEKNKTSLENLDDICKKLGRPPIHLLKFFGYELGTSTIIKHERYFLRGEYTVSQLSTLIDKFMEKFVTCEVCGNPETELESEAMTCRACGEQTKIDKTHKLTKYLFRNK